jgi:hypothetical protein
LGALKAADSAVVYTLKQILANKKEDEETRLESAKSLVLLGKIPKLQILRHCRDEILIVDFEKKSTVQQFHFFYIFFTSQEKKFLP